MTAHARVSRALIHSTAGTFATRVLGALGGVAVARLLGPAGRGDLAILVVIASVASLVGAAGLQFWIARDVARAGHASSLTVSIVVRHSIVVLVAGAALAAGVVVSPITPETISVAALVATITFAATGAVAFVWLALPNGARAMGVVSVATAGGSALYLVGALVLALADRPSVATVLLLGTLGNVVTVAICAGYVARERACHADVGGERRAPLMTTWGRGLRYGLAGGLGEIVLFGMLRVDFLLVGAFLPAADVGVYAVATALTELLWIVPDGTAQIALPSTAADDDAALPAAFRLALVTTAAAGLLLSLAATPLLRIVFGAPYAAGADAVPFLALAAVAGGAWKMLAADLAARHTTRDRLHSAVAGLVAMVAVDLVLIPAYGIAGASAGAAIGYLVAAALVVVVWCRTTGRPIRELAGLRRGDLAMLRRPGMDAGPVAVGSGAA